jgi:hypothetical protein
VAYRGINVDQDSIYHALLRQCANDLLLALSLRLTAEHQSLSLDSTDQQTFVQLHSLLILHSLDNSHSTQWRYLVFDWAEKSLLLRNVFEDHLYQYLKEHWDLSINHSQYH